jgi:hypothetical protein
VCWFPIEGICSLLGCVAVCCVAGAECCISRVQYVELGRVLHCCIVAKDEEVVRVAEANQES